MIKIGDLYKLKSISWFEKNCKIIGSSYSYKNKTKNCRNINIKNLDPYIFNIEEKNYPDIVLNYGLENKKIIVNFEELNIYFEKVKEEK